MATKSKSRWRRQESRPVRPFRSAGDYLSQVGLRLYADDEFKSVDGIYVNSIERERLALAIKIPRAPDDLEEVVGIPLKDLRLAVTLEDRAFKDSGVGLNVPLSEVSGASQIFDIDADTVALMSWAGETRVHVAVVLTRNRNGEVGTAQRLGSWGASKTFGIGNPRDTASFQIDAVDPSYFESRNLPAETTYLVEINDSDLNQSCENLPDLVKISLAKEVHGALAKDEDSPMAKALIKTIYVDVVTTVLATGYVNMGKREPLQEGGILDVVTTKLVKSTGISAERLRVLAEENAGSQLRAVVQADVELSRALISAAQRRPS